MVSIGKQVLQDRNADVSKARFRHLLCICHCYSWNVVKFFLLLVVYAAKQCVTSELVALCKDAKSCLLTL